MTARARWLGLVVVLVVAVGSVLVLAAADRTRGTAATAGPDGEPTPAGPPPGPPDATVPQVDTAALVAAVPQREVARLPDARVAEDVLPQSNRWYSGLVFGDQPVFATPLSFAVEGPGFTIGLPQPVASATTVAGPHVAALTVDVGAASYRVSAADPVAVTLELLDDADRVLGHVALAEGSPVVTFTAARDVTVRTTTASGALVTDQGPDQGPDQGSDHGPATASGDVAGTTWGLVGPGYDEGASRLREGDVVGWYALPADASSAAQDALAAAAQHPVAGVDVTYGVDDEVARTTLTYRTGGAAAYVLSPHHRVGTQPERAGCGLGEYASVGGALELCAGSVLTAYAPVTTAVDVPDLDGVPRGRLDELRSTLAADVAATPAFPSDTYFGGKALFRAATLVVLGERLGADDVVADLRVTTESALREWAEPDGCERRDARCVVYDASARSAIGLTPSFGSDELNDHHFHYGYLLAAAGLLAQDHPALATDLAPVLDLLAADVAAATPGADLPQLRSFDPYQGHSWASGTSPFADGNNQESSSEAVNAWNGLGLWARASGNDALATQAAWLQSTESAAARAYWTDPTEVDGFDHTIVSLVWGGKRDYATWFSPEPAAILGIQLIPMGPAQRATATGVDPEQILAAVDEAAAGGYDVQFGGYLLAYRALAGRSEADDAWDALVTAPDVAIDDGTSRTALLAFVADAAT
ncbi:1,3-beta-glucanase [Cellulomonas sp. DKR-3]|uniref:glucan endo-1,3-beta-D-glucosidase n=1 Tax=Cellulomonas fulva TaxID=2835530 RepID=A0ABS5U0M4_9CELL|nr:glycosyl hydrolase [Cellulomonas fulva]MBT0994951.1 1,3-beta-glucanase [Cellulomonas fulva]